MKKTYIIMSFLMIAITLLLLQGSLAYVPVVKPTTEQYMEIKGLKIETPLVRQMANKSCLMSNETLGSIGALSNGTKTCFIASSSGNSRTNRDRQAHGVPEFSLFTLALAIVIGGLGLGIMRRRR